MTKPVYVMSCGNVDDGKSTILGSIIYHSKNLYKDQIKAVETFSKKYGHKKDFIDYSLVLDGLIDERNQGITIDLAYRYLQIGKKDFIFIDSPGHTEFTKNTASAGSFANIALIIVDITKNISDQTISHMEYISSFNNIDTLIFCINKLDLVDYELDKYKKIKDELENKIDYLKINNKKIIFLPTVGTKSENVTKNSENMTFYKGLNLFSILSNYKPNLNREVSKIQNSIISVSLVSKKESSGRIFFGNLIGDPLKIGSELFNIETNQKSKIKNFYKDFQNVKKINNGESFGFEIEKPISISKGSFLVKNNKNIIYSDSLKSSFIQTSNEEIEVSKRYIFQFHNFFRFGFFSSVKYQNFKNISYNTIELEGLTFAMEKKFNTNLSNFLCIDPISNETVGFGQIEYALDRGSNIVHQELPKHDLQTSKLKCIWLTGLSGAGKTTLAIKIGNRFKELSLPYYILDGDNLRKTLNKDLGFSNSDRFENNRRVAHLAKILYDSGVIPIVATISPKKSMRSFARSLFEPDKFIEIFVDASIETCKKRDPKGLYKNSKNINNITGVHQEYEIPEKPEITVDTDASSIVENAEEILLKLKLGEEFSL